ncbi:MAG: VWA domain-containing protein [Acidimicrobiales bacterium]
MSSLFEFDFAAGVDADGMLRGSCVATGVRPKFSDKLESAGIMLRQDSLVTQRPVPVCGGHQVSQRLLGRALLSLGLAAVLVSNPQVAAAQEDAEPLPLEVLAVSTQADGRIAIELSAPPDLTGVELPASAFRVTQDGVDRPLSSQRLPNDELDVVLVVDISGSMAGAAMANAREAAIAFLRQLPADADIALVSFGPEATLVRPFGSSPQDVADAVTALEPDGETALYDGIDLAIDQFAVARSSRRTVVVLSDGDDTVSATTKDEANQRIAAGGVNLYAISLGAAQTGVLGELVSNADGGLVASADDPAGLIGIYDRIGQLLANQYRLLFTPASGIDSTGTVYVSQLGVEAAADFDFDDPPSVAAATSSESKAPDASGGFVAPAPTVVVVSAPWVSSDAARIAGVATIGLSLLLVGLLLFSSGPSIRLAGARIGQGTKSFASSTSGEKVRDSAEGIAERMLAKRDRGRMVGVALERAGSTLRPAEFVVLSASAGVVAAALLALVGGALAAVLGAVSVFFGLRAWLGPGPQPQRGLYRTTGPDTAASRWLRFARAMPFPRPLRSWDESRSRRPQMSSGGWAWSYGLAETWVIRWRTCNPECSHRTLPGWCGQSTSTVRSAETWPRFWTTSNRRFATGPISGASSSRSRPRGGTRPTCCCRCRSSLRARSL